MLRHVRAALMGVVAALGLVSGAHAQLADRKVLTLAEARKLVAAAEADAAKINLAVAVAVVDEGGHLLMFERMDDAQLASVKIAIAKARSALMYKRPTKIFEDAVVGGRSVILSLPDALPIEGGLPLVAAGKPVGAIGISGGTPQQDGAIAAAAAAGLAK